MIENLNDESYIFILNKLYPDKIVYGFQTLQPRLYQEIRNYASDKGLTIKEYIIGLGFDYMRKNQMEVFSEDEVIKELDNLYPDKIIGNLREIQKQNNILYFSITKNAREKNIDTYSYLLQLGYVRNKESLGQSNIIYDTISLKRLKKEYSINLSQFARWLGVSKQNLDNKMSRKRDLYPYWQGKELDSYEIEIINLMITEKLFCHITDDSRIINIFKSNHDDSFAILIINEHDVKCFFEIPEDITNKLIENGYHKYNSKDFEILKELNTKSDLIDIDESGIFEVQIKDVELDRKIQSVLTLRRSSEYGFSKNKYFEFLGFKKKNSNLIVSDDVYQILTNYLIENTNTIKIPIDDPQYHRLCSLAIRRGFTGIKAYVESFGFKYSNTRNSTTRKRSTLEKAKEEILEHYIVYDNNIYISSNEPLYLQLVRYGQNKNLKIDDIVCTMGFVRMKRQELPEWYKPYQTFLNGVGVHNINQDLLEDIKKHTIQGNQIYVSSYDPLYDRLFRYAQRRDITINDLFEQLNYKRVYNTGRNSESKEFHWIDDSESEEAKDYIKKMLERVKKIQGNLTRSKNTREKIHRSADLAKTMKELYNYRCQLCCPDESGFSSPRIEIGEDKFYVELHHIVHVSKIDKVTDDSRRKIDSYENVVVVCPHHHKYLHYHNGGFDSLVVDQNENIYFVSKDERHKIYTDYHLKYRKDIDKIKV